jgi:glycosyltransferase involved in cell wall biosynthesis
LNLAAVGPLPPASSGVADHSLILLRHLRRHFESIVAVVDQGAKQTLHPADFDAVYEYCDGDWRWWQAGRFLPLYQMGNHVTYHRYVYDLLTKIPGVTVLHDGNLLPFVHAITLEEGRRDAYVREISAAAQDGCGHQRAWNSIRGSDPLDPDEFRLLHRVVRSSLGVLVHNTYLRDYIHQVEPATRVDVVPLVNVESENVTGMSRDEARRKLGLDRDAFLLGTIGYIAPSKRLDAVLETLHRLSPSFPRLNLICVGQVLPWYDLQAQVDTLGLRDRVEFTGYVSPEQLELFVYAMDIGLNLRYPTWGEASSALLRLMAAGRASIVTDAGGFRDLPDDVVLKVPAGPEEVSALTDAVETLLRDAALCEAIGDAARAHVRRHHSPEVVAAAYARSIRGIVHGEAV